MSLVNLVNVQVLNNPCKFLDPFQFEITFEVVSELSNDIEFKILYVSSEDQNQDQELESVMVGPVPVGISKFVMEAPAPDHTKIPQEDLMGLTVVLVSCLYLGKEFIRVGYYLNNSNPDQPEDEEPVMCEIEKIQRHILAEKPRVTRFPIEWDSKDKLPVVEMPTEL
ncbi:histone chaperone ASF1B-like protein [Gorgonomyces haynaldii]|nr:histone chaperone ASF1B-like protein [Gorgonomyces haynaldii]